MFSGSYIAQKSCSGCSCDSSTNSCSYMIISWCYIRHKRSKNIERRSLADSLLYLHVSFYLIHRHMSRAFYHYLNISCPCSLCEFSKPYKLLYLTSVSSIGQTSRSACITETYGHIVLSAYLKNLIIVLVERVLLTCHCHPRKHKASSAAYNVHLSLAVLYLLYGISAYSAVKGNKVYAILCMKSYNVHKVLSCQGCEISFVMYDRIIDRHSTNHRRT